MDFLVRIVQTGEERVMPDVEAATLIKRGTATLVEQDYNHPDKLKRRGIVPPRVPPRVFRKPQEKAGAPENKVEHPPERKS